MNRQTIKEFAFVLLMTLWSFDCAIIFFNHYRHIWIGVFILIVAQMLFGRIRINVTEFLLLTGIFLFYFFWQKNANIAYIPVIITGLEYSMGKAMGKAIRQVEKRTIVFSTIGMSTPFIVRALLNYSYFLTHDNVVDGIWPYWEVPTSAIPRTQHEFFLVIPAAFLVFWLICVKKYKFVLIGLLETAIGLFLAMYGRGRLAFCGTVVTAIVIGVLYAVDNRELISLKKCIKTGMLLVSGLVVLWVDQGRFYSLLSSMNWASDGGVFRNVRFILWKNAFKLMLENPFGASHIKIPREIDDFLDCFAHNSWIDVGYCGGVIPFLLVLTFTIIVLVYSFKLWMNEKGEAKYAIITPFLGMSLYHMFEPAIAASPLFWGAEVFLSGIIVGWWLEIRNN